ncbi:hypothetical protein EV360DRAFT_84406 [Lentinula raphanica]|nr:hypothetical protein EV360DRAFT_84406 [Lentinula raphanica]
MTRSILVLPLGLISIFLASAIHPEVFAAPTSFNEGTERNAPSGELASTTSDHSGVLGTAIKAGAGEVHVQPLTPFAGAGAIEPKSSTGQWMRREESFDSFLIPRAPPAHDSHHTTGASSQNVERVEQSSSHPSAEEPLSETFVGSLHKLEQIFSAPGIDVQKQCHTYHEDIQEIIDKLSSDCGPEANSIIELECSIIKSALEIAVDICTKVEGINLRKIAEHENVKQVAEYDISSQRFDPPAAMKEFLASVNAQMMNLAQSFHDEMDALKSISQHFDDLRDLWLEMAVHLPFPSVQYDGVEKTQPPADWMNIMRGGSSVNRALTIVYRICDEVHAVVYRGKKRWWEP